MPPKPPKKLLKLSPLALALLEKLTSRGGWHRIDKNIGYALVRRGLVDSRRAQTGRGWEYRIHQDALWEPPQPPLLIDSVEEPEEPKPQSRTPLLDWLEAKTNG